MPNRLTRSPELPRLTLRLNETGWREACTRAGVYGDSEIAALIGVTSVTVYRVRTGRLAPGTSFIAQAVARLGARFDELFIPETVAA